MIIMTRDEMKNNYIPLESRFIKYLRDGDEVIVEQHHFNSVTGQPAPSEWFRTYAGHHKITSGMATDLHSEPNLFFPEVPRWQMSWIYAGNNYMTSMWIHHSLAARIQSEVIREGGRWE